MRIGEVIERLQRIADERGSEVLVVFVYEEYNEDDWDPIVTYRAVDSITAGGDFSSDTHQGPAVIID